jgi:tetratricopeptide (TPR) repeat protein
LQRDLAGFSVDAAQRIAGPLSGQLLRLANAAKQAITATSPIDRELAYLEFANYYRGANDPVRARNALEPVDVFIKQARLSGNGEHDLGLLQMQMDEISGDVNRRDERDLAKAALDYSDALRILDGFGEADSDVAQKRARLLRKMADLKLQQSVAIGVDDIAVAAAIAAVPEQLDAAQHILDRYPAPQPPWAVHESGLLAATGAELFLRKGLKQEATSRWTRAVDLLRKAHEAEPRDSRTSLELATTLQKQGDLQRRTGDRQALTTYISALELLDEILADDPTSFTALSAIQLARHGIRLLGAATQADTAAMRKREEVTLLLDRDFGNGIGKFMFGMQPSEINGLLSKQFDDRSLDNLPRAEAPTGDVRYLYIHLQDEPYLWPLPPSACMRKERIDAVLMFHEDSLFRFDFRFYPPPEGTCDERSTAFEKFAKQYGLTTIGSDGERRFRYETEHVAVEGVADLSQASTFGVSFRFTQR